MTSRTITIPAREVRPGDVLFGMTVKDAYPSPLVEPLTSIDFGAGFPAVMVHKDGQWTVERPVPSDPIGTVRTDFNGTEHPVIVYVKVADDEWECSGSQVTFTDADVADFLILWKPGMPIPDTEETA